PSSDPRVVRFDLRGHRNGPWKKRRARGRSIPGNPSPRLGRARRAGRLTMDARIPARSTRRFPMKKPMRLLPMLAAPALLGLAACQTSPDAGPAAPSLAFEQDAALRAASDSLGVPRPPREAACVVLRARLAE